ncbi:MAG: hypothetical protein PHD43_17410 [Methylococcales bacterium]|nr:hypothetical protein [Methylococcales bacterium]
MTKTEVEKQKIMSYLISSEEDIESNIGRILLASEAGPTLSSPKDSILLELVTKYFDERLELFRQKICVEWNLDGKFNSGDMESNVELIASLADLLSPIVGAPPAAMVATLLFKRGLKTLCIEEPPNGEIKPK